MPAAEQNHRVNSRPKGHAVLSPQLCRQSLLSCVRYFQIARQQVLAVYKCFHPRNTGGEPRCCSFFAASLKRKTARKQHGIYFCLDYESFSFFPPRCSNRLMVFQSANSTSEVSAVLVAAAVAPSSWKVICVSPQARGQFYASLTWEDKKMCCFFATCLGKSTPGPAPFSSVELGAFADSPSRAESPSFSVLAFTRVERARACWLPNIQNTLQAKKHLQVPDGFPALPPGFLHKSPAIGFTCYSSQATSTP